MYCCVFLLVALLPYVAKGEEDLVCPKFAYDEALLEKLVRNDMKLDQVHLEFKELRADVSTILETIQAKQSNSGKNLQSSEQKKGESELSEEVKMALENSQANVQHKLDNMEESIRNLQAMNQKDSVTPIIGFKATSGTKMNPSRGDVLIFPDVLLNVGDGYNSTSGIFTAPVSGLYLLTVQTCITARRYHAASIMVQGKEMGRVFTTDHDWSVCNSGNAIAYMDANGDAYIITRNTSGPLKYGDSERQVSFAGALLNKAA